MAGAVAIYEHRRGTRRQASLMLLLAAIAMAVLGCRPAHVTPSGGPWYPDRIGVIASVSTEGDQMHLVLADGTKLDVPLTRYNPLIDYTLEGPFRAGGLLLSGAVNGERWYLVPRKSSNDTWLGITHCEFETVARMVINRGTSIEIDGATFRKASTFFAPKGDAGVGERYGYGELGAAALCFNEAGLVTGVY